MNKPMNRDKTLFGWLWPDKCWSATPYASQLIIEVLRDDIRNDIMMPQSTQRLRRLRWPSASCAGRIRQPGVSRSKN